MWGITPRAAFPPHYLSAGLEISGRQLSFKSHALSSAQPQEQLSSGKCIPAGGMTPHDGQSGVLADFIQARWALISIAGAVKCVDVAHRHQCGIHEPIAQTDSPMTF